MRNKHTKLWMVPILLLGLSALIVISCSKDNSGKLPQVKTLEVTDVKHSSAKSGGEITSDGGSLITAIGVCWSTHDKPTVSDFYTSDGQYTLEGVVTRAFSSLLKDLEPKTRYYMRAYAANESGVAYGETKSFETDEAGQIIIPLTADMIEVWTLEPTEGSKEALVDGQTSTYWHSAWSAGVNPLPHWIQITFPEAKEIGGFHYTFRQPSGITDRPNKFDFQTSADGQSWTTVWTSAAKLPVEPVDEMQTLVFGQNFSARFFRIRILDTHGSRDWTHLSTIQVFTNKN